MFRLKLLIQILITIIIIIILIYSYKYKNSKIKINALENIPMDYIINSNPDQNKDILNLNSEEVINIPIKDLIKTPLIGQENKNKLNNKISEINKNINNNISDIKTNIDNYNISKIKQEQEDLLLQTKVEFNDIKQLLQKQNHIINKQTELLDKQAKLLDKIPQINKITHNKYDDAIIEHKDENIEVYFKDLRAINDTNIKNEADIDYEEYYRNNIKYVKSYLEDPATRGYNIYESEQFSKLLDIGNIKVNDKVEPLPYPTNYARSIELKKI
jgi:hypothetical protein